MTNSKKPIRVYKPRRKSSTRSRRIPRGSKRFLAYLKKEPSELKKKMLFIGYLFNKLSKKDVKAYVVGGEAVEIYTAGQFTTGDIDITVTDREKTVKLLVEMGFTQTGRIWLNENVGLAIDIVSTFPSRTEKARIIEVGDFKVNVVGVEDLVIDRLTAAKYWRSNPKLDIEQAAVLLTAFKNSVDLEYIRKRAVEEKVDDYLQEIEKWPLT
ncbi:MAG: DUF6036 family nucleotidyltransferase [Candidatus Bathyarchaeia archaeon]